MCNVYSALPGFPSPTEQPAYYEMLINIGAFARKPDTEVLVALSAADELLGGVVYFGDMAEYGSGGSATQEQDASGVRLLAVSPAARSQGVGKALTHACIERARQRHHKHVVLHTTEAMQIAWGMYQRLGFERATDLDFMQEKLPVFGFRLRLEEPSK
ncbi:MAG: GNAT family N-acetyltransferase [Gammaproteobacteria bacterium]|nr:GNAT family N-acetyltransferase [Gammaproteobacteria bacterium]